MGTPVRKRRHLEKEHSPQDNPVKHLPLTDVCVLIDRVSVSGRLVALRMGLPKRVSNLEGTNSTNVSDLHSVLLSFT